MTDKEEQEKKRLEKLSRPEDLDQMLSVAQPRRRWLFIVLIALIAALVLWAFFGSIPIHVNGRGVALSPEGVFTIESKTSGIVTEIFVKEGDSVTPRTKIAFIENPKRKSLLQNIESTKQKIDGLKEELTTLDARLKTREKLFKEGLIAETVLENTKLAVIDKKNQIETLKAQIADDMANLQTTSAIGSLPKEKLLAKYELTPDALERLLGTVYSPYAGNVLEVLVDPGDVVKEKNPLVWMEYPHKKNEPIHFLCCIPVQEQNRIKAGMDARIEPTIVNPQEYGAIIAKVKEVSPFVVSEQELLNNLDNPQLVKYLMGNQKGVMRVEVQPELNSKTKSGLAWTSQSGPPFKIPTGTLCIVKIVVQEQPPISFMIPTWKLKPSL